MKIDYSKIYDEDLRKGDAHMAILQDYRREEFLDQTSTASHYSWLAYLSNQISNGIIIEVGSFLGLGTIALANNPSNRVITYDLLPILQAGVGGYFVEEIIDKNFFPLNIEVMVKEDGNILGEEEATVTMLDARKEVNTFQRPNDPKTIIKSDLIFLDAAHDGKMEQEIYDFLCRNDYKGILLLDDISLNKEMALFWRGIDKKKYDITEIGHGKDDDFNRSGTGLVDFSGNVEIVRPTSPPALT